MRSTRSIDVQGVGHLAFSLSVKVVTQYQRGVLFRLGTVVGVKEPGLALIIPVIDRLVRVSLRIVTMPIQSQGIITRDNVSVDISAVAYFRVVDPLKSVIAIEKRRRHDQPRSRTRRCARWSVNTPRTRRSPKPTSSTSTSRRSSKWRPRAGPEVKRATAWQAVAEQEKRAKFIAAEGESMAAAVLGVRRAR